MQRTELTYKETKPTKLNKMSGYSIKHFHTFNQKFQPFWQTQLKTKSQSADDKKIVMLKVQDYISLVSLIPKYKSSIFLMSNF